MPRHEPTITLFGFADADWPPIIVNKEPRSRGCVGTWKSGFHKERGDTEGTHVMIDEILKKARSAIRGLNYIDYCLL